MHVEALPWAVGHQRFTRALLVTIATWSRVLPWQQVAVLFGRAWGTVERAVEAAVAYGLAHRDLSGVTPLGIDERATSTSPTSTMWAANGCSGAARAARRRPFRAFFDFLGPERTAGLEGICCDMWPPYITIITARAPGAVLVLDKFHIVSHLMAAVDQVRRDEIREKGPDHRALMHKTRFIWQQPLSELERLNLKINRAYLLKELFAQFWTYRRAGWARRYLKQWFWWATHARLPPLRDFAWMLRRHEDDILNYFRMPIDNGTVEGLNNKAKLIIHKAYGFRTAKNYIRNLYNGMADLPLPQTVHTFV